MQGRRDQADSVQVGGWTRTLGARAMSHDHLPKLPCMVDVDTIKSGGFHQRVDADQMRHASWRHGRRRD